MRKISIDHAIAAVADRQHGNVTRGQLTELGVTKRAIDYRIESGRLHRVHVGVYSVGRPAKTMLEHAAAAVLACGPRAALSHLSALHLWGFWKPASWASRHHVTLPRGADRRPAAVNVHRCSSLTRRDVRSRHAIRVTSPARTLLDSAPLLSARQLTRAVNDALLTPHLKRDHLVELLARTMRHPGNPVLLALTTRDAENPTRSALEDDFKSFCKRFGLPAPRVNIALDGREVDAFFETENVIVELDSYSFHSDRDTFERDREKDAAALLAGRATIRITGARMSSDPAAEAARLSEILAARRSF